jgi:t-SNARE complex subunit (syntaxin)
VLAIITTILCCLPLGIWGIVKAAEVNGKWERGDLDGARASAAMAKKVSLIGIGVGVLVIVVYVVLLVGGVLASSN